MTTIFLVEHTINSDEDSFTAPLKAFRDKNAALQFIDDCYTESIRVVEDLMKYWDEHMDEFEELNKELNKMVRENRKIDKNSEFVKRHMKIREDETQILMSHKHHPGVIRDRTLESEYDMTEIELVE